MTYDQVKNVKQSWRILQKIKPSVIAGTFYSKLFADMPALRKMFPPNMDAQYAKLMDMLSIIVARLDNIESLAEEINVMARRHIQYGVKPAHYKVVGKALLWTLEKGLGEDWRLEVKEAWTICYNSLAEIMIAASAEERVK